MSQSDKQEQAFEAWWREWRTINCYSDTPRMRDAARVVWEEIRGNRPLPVGIPSAVASGPRGAYVPLTEAEIEALRPKVIDDELNEHMDRLCHMAINSLLYAQEIDRLRSLPSATGGNDMAEKLRSVARGRYQRDPLLSIEGHAATHIDDLTRLLVQAVELFEGDEECNKVGTAAWVWLRQAKGFFAAASTSAKGGTSE